MTFKHFNYGVYRGEAPGVGSSPTSKGLKRRCEAASAFPCQLGSFAGPVDGSSVTRDSRSPLGAGCPARLPRQILFLDTILRYRISGGGSLRPGRIQCCLDERGQKHQRYNSKQWILGLCVDEGAIYQYHNLIHCAGAAPPNTGPWRQRRRSKLCMQLAWVITNKNTRTKEYKN